MKGSAFGRFPSHDPRFLMSASFPAAPPPLTVLSIGRGDVSAVPALADRLTALVKQHGTLYEWAANQPQPRALRGRAPVFVATVPDSNETVVVRHAWHGGVFAPLTTDRFRWPTRAPHEYAMSAALIAADIPTTHVLGFVRYRTWFGFCRVDVVSRFVPNAYDLGMVVAGLVPEIQCHEALAATQRLLVRLAHAGVVHPDLNVKNILLVRHPDESLTAMIIDVDVVRWRRDRNSLDTMQRNVDRLTRSLRKWHRHFGCDVTEAMLARFTNEALQALPVPSVAGAKT